MWPLGMGLAHLFIYAKDSSDLTGILAIFLVGAVLGLILSYASDKPQSLRAAGMKLIYWPAALIIFVSFAILKPDPRQYLKEAIAPALVAGAVGLGLGLMHFLVAYFRLRKRQEATHVSP